MKSSSRTGQGYRINSKQSARRVEYCRADDSPSPLPHQSHQQGDAIKCSTMPQVTITPGIEHSGIMIRDTSNIEENKSQSKVVAGTVNSKEQSQSHVCQWRNQQLMRGERPRAAVAPMFGTLPGTLVDPIRGPPPASVGDENRPNCRQHDHLVVPHGIYCTLVALASSSFSTVFLISFVQAKRGDCYTSTSWAPYVWHFAMLILTGCAAMHLIVAIIGVSHNLRSLSKGNKSSTTGHRASSNSGLKPSVTKAKAKRDDNNTAAAEPADANVSDAVARAKQRIRQHRQKVRNQGVF